jgi:5-methylcytosine-specific restriction endonuclease McrA
VLRQNQAGGQAAIVAEIVRFRGLHSSASRALPELVRRDPSWPTLVTKVEETLAEWPIPRLQRPYEPFLYTFDWTWEEDRRWSARRYRTSSRTITMFPGVGDALTSLGPMLRPFITRWWTDKAAQLNPDVEAAPVIEFEDFLFGRDRVALDRVGEGLLDLQHGDCFYCHARIGSRREIDHFIPWSHSGDDGLDNLVAACHKCNNRKRATLPGPEHLHALLGRNRAWTADLAAIADERRWPRDYQRSVRIARTAYLQSPDERLLWIRTPAGDHYERLGEHRQRLNSLLPLTLPDA